MAVAKSPFHLSTPFLSEEKAQSCDIAWLRQLLSRDSIPEEEFTQVALVNTREGIKPVYAGNDPLHFYVMQSTGRQNKCGVAKLSRDVHASPFHITEHQPQGHAAGTKTLAWIGSRPLHNLRNA